MGGPALFQLGLEVLHKLRAVVGQNIVDRFRHQFTQQPQGVCAAPTAAGSGSPRKRNARARVNEGEHVAVGETRPENRSVFSGERSDKDVGAGAH